MSSSPASSREWRLLHQRRVRHGPPRPCVHGGDRQILPGGQGVRLPDGGRGQGAGAGARRGREAGGRRHRRGQGELQAGRAAEPARPRRQAGHRWRHGVHLRAGPRRSGRRLSRRARHARGRPGPPRGGQGQGDFCSLCPPTRCAGTASRRTPTNRRTRPMPFPTAGRDGHRSGEPGGLRRGACRLQDDPVERPMGVFEFDRFAEGTNHIAQAIVQETGSGAHTLVGGGDSVAAVNKAASPTR